MLHHDKEFKEPFRSQFIELIARGAASRDIHDAPKASGYAQASSFGSRLFVQREVERPYMHFRNICRYIADIPARRLLDVGCGTAALSVALSWAFPETNIDGFDADHSAIKAGQIRISGYGLSDRIDIQAVRYNRVFPFESGSFDIVTCTSVIEFITEKERRETFLQEIHRVVRPGGSIVIITPNAFYPVELHSHRIFQNWRREVGYPWAPTRAWLDRRLKGCTLHSKPERIADKFRSRFGWPLPLPFAALVEPFLPWQFIVARTPSTAERC
jgi:2-polyprenyl-3-methyl-5-hydroxy-6-metoxy-1,4-benzoquinol methylase